ncbi:hypothetical protein [Ferrovibrio sp.]|uniref:hypothetical protein n=1 Tax=Ferrovibrio sp. TaxID=1917215 RepID=UPI00311DDD32
MTASLASGNGRIPADADDDGPPHIGWTADSGPAGTRYIQMPDGRRRYAPRPGERINWPAAAALLAQGKSVEAVAEAMLCEPERIWRNMKRSARFRARIALEHERQALQTGLQFRSLGGRLVGQIAGHADRLDAKTLQWMANRLNLSQVAHAGQELTERLEELAALPPVPAGKTRAASADTFTRKFLAALSDGDAAAIRTLAKAELVRREAFKVGAAKPVPADPAAAGADRPESAADRP